MNRARPLRLLLASFVFAMPGGVSLAGSQGPASLAGNWTLNRDLSQFPRDVGFGMDVIPSGTGDRAGTEDSALASALRGDNRRPVSEDESLNTRQLVAEVKDPPRRLTIAQSGAAVTMTDDRGVSRTFHTDGREPIVTLDAGPVKTITRWDGARLVVRYQVQPDRELRYTYSVKADPPQLVVQTQFVERGGHDVVTRVYEPSKPGEPALPDRAVPSSIAPQRPGLASQLPAAPAAKPAGAAGQAPVGQEGTPRPDQPGSRLMPVSPDRAAALPLAQGTDVELRGLSSLGIVVEELSSPATSCGLRQDTLESTVSKSLSDAGLKVVTNSDEDTYLYVRVVTTAMSTGFCFSRYDVTLYTHTTATLSYGSAAVLVQVELLRNGGIAGGGASGHGESVVRNIKQYADAFAARIRAANQ